jgi:ArsR family transcriptional regulator
MDWNMAAQGFAAMGSEARLLVLRTLIRAGHQGLSVGELQNRTGITPSTLAHHLKFLTGADLIDQKRDGRSVLNYARFDQLEALSAFILTECCADSQRSAANDG